VAEALVRMSPEAAAAVSAGTAPKGDVAAVARVAGIMATKRTPDLIPLCHPLPIERAGVDVEVAAEEGLVRVVATVETTARTGVEMEALVGAAIAALAVYDMVKGIDRGVVVEQVRLVEKTKGAVADGAA
jgi:cyclic pyranopterin phosphate synthase